MTIRQGFPVRLAAAAVLAVLSLVAAACGGRSSPEVTKGPSSATTPTSSTVATPRTPPTNVDFRGQTIPLGLSYRGVDPQPLLDSEPTAVGTSPAPAAPSVGYTGLLGSLTPDQVVVAALAAPPPALPAGIAPLTGLPLGDPAAANRSAIVVKIDNVSRARPQTGLLDADIVFEERVEGGLTRLAAVFHSGGGTVGPVRSGRTSDIPILGSLARPGYVWSGANRVFGGLLRQQPIQDRGAETTTGYWRSSSQQAPHNLFTDLGPVWGSIDAGPPPPHFEYRAAGASLPTGAAPAAEVSLRYPNITVSWRWTGGAWERSMGSKVHTDAAGAPVQAANVVAVELVSAPTGLRAYGADITEDVFVGAGRAVVFTAGHAVEAIWTKPTLASVATITLADGTPIALTAGSTWVQLVNAGAIAWS
ncbi:MAG: DUF3048 domain-containing protein [Actinomycetia bacterium]|nr:DUF3048 domain-containing protein [Actinomycetes bacterium]